jgi:hypothetical protein
MKQEEWQVLPNLINLVDNNLGDDMSYPKHYFGFVYHIVVELNYGTFVNYIGKKNFSEIRKKKLTKKELLDNKSKKDFKYVKTESNWRTYNSSNKELKELIEWGTYKSVTKTMIHICSSELELRYGEAKEIMIRDALIRKDYLNSGFSFNIMSKLDFKK